MKDLLVPAKQAVQLKELGFDEPCLFGYNQDEQNKLMTVPQLSSYDINSAKNSDASKINKVTAPLKQQVFKWFRQKYNLFGCIDLQCSTPAHWYVRIDDIIENDFVYHSEDYHIKYNTYEEAEMACIDKLIEIIKSK
jgi:hypothetical protein